MLLDTSALKSILVKMANFGQNEKVPLSSTFSKILTKGILIIEQLLKVVSRAHDPPDGIVETYMRMYSDQNVSQLQKILELKGLRRAEQLVVIDLFQKKIGILVAPINTSNSSQISTISVAPRNDVKDSTTITSSIKNVEAKRISNLFNLGKRA
jgi:hypothetical protein